MVLNELGNDVWAGVEGIFYCDGARLEGNGDVAVAGLRAAKALSNIVVRPADHGRSS